MRQHFLIPDSLYIVFFLYTLLNKQETLITDKKWQAVFTRAPNGWKKIANFAFKEIRWIR